MTTVTPTDFRIVEDRTTSPVTVPSGESISSRKGKFCRVDPTTSKAMLANASSAAEAGGIHGFAMSNQRFVGDAVSLFRKGLVDLGSGLDALDSGSIVYLGDTDNLLQTTAGTVSISVGKVYPITESDGSVKKLLDVDVE